MANFRETPNCQHVPVQVVGSSTFGRFHKISSAYTQNMYESDGWLIGYSGYKKFLQLVASEQGRGMFRSVRANLIIAVVGGQVYVVDSNYNIYNVKTSGGQGLNTESGEVFMAENLNSQVCLVDGTNMYILNVTKPYTLTQQTGAPLDQTPPQLTPNYVSFHDTFFLIGNGSTTNNGAKWYAYSFLSATTIQMTTQLQLQTKPDYAIAIVPIPSQANNVLVFGKTVCEIQQNIGGIQNYRRNQSVNIDFGCLSVATIARSDKFIVWLGVNEDNAPVIMVFQGQAATPISSDGIDYVLGNIKYPDQSTALFHRQDGHLFYQLTFYNPADNLTLLYDFNNKKFYNATDQNGNFHPALDAVYFNLRTFFLSLTNGAIYEINSNFYSIDENESMPLQDDYDPLLVYDMPRTRICESIRNKDSSRFIANSFVFTMDQGNDPNVTEISILKGYPNLMITESSFIPPEVPIVTEDGTYIVGEQPNVSLPTPGAGELAQYLPPVQVVYRPRVDCTISLDGGVTWSSTVWVELNPIGDRKNIITFENMGAANDLTIKLRFWGLWAFIVSDGDLQVY